MCGPDGPEERAACADEALEAAFEQIEIDEQLADEANDDPENWNDN